MTFSLSSPEHLKVFQDAGIPTRIITDTAVGVVMEEVDLVLVGAEGVMENGGIINKVSETQIYLHFNRHSSPLDWNISNSISC